MNRFYLCLAWATLLSVGCCTPRVVVHPHPDCDTPGIRYYRPKPYLLVLPFSEATQTTTTTVDSESSAKGKVTNKTEYKGIDADHVQMRLEYLPDFSEEYAIDVRSGLGTNDTEIKLENGWNLTSINQRLDSQFDENVTALARLADAGAGLKGAAAGGQPELRVAARNVPLGYYESVVERDACGVKRLLGWRYVGFAPFAGACEAPETSAGSAGLYGLVFYGGVMTFRPLAEVEAVERDEILPPPKQAADSSRRQAGALPSNAEESVESPQHPSQADERPAA